MNEWMDECMDGWMNKWSDEYIEYSECILHLYSFPRVQVKPIPCYSIDSFIERHKNVSKNFFSHRIPPPPMSIFCCSYLLSCAGFHN